MYLEKTHGNTIEFKVNVSIPFSKFVTTSNLMFEILYLTQKFTKI